MGLFGKKPSVSYTERKATRITPFSYSMSEAQRREIAIDYINGLTKKDLDLFIESIQLIWQGYNIMNRVKTVAEKKEEKIAKEEGVFDLSGVEDEEIGYLDINEGKK